MIMKSYNKIIVGLIGDGGEKEVVEHAYQLSINLDCKLSVIHVNDMHAGDMSMMMDSPKEVTTDDIKTQLNKYLGEDNAKTIDVLVHQGESISKTIQKHSQDCDLFIVGHRKMSQFKANFMDSVDEGITNLISCPVLVVQK